MFGTEENKNILSFPQYGWVMVHSKWFLHCCTTLYYSRVGWRSLIVWDWTFASLDIYPTSRKLIFLPQKVVEKYQTLCPDSNLQYLLFDFEQSAIKTFKEIWPMTYIKGFFFRLSQSVDKKCKNSVYKVYF